MLNKEDYEEQCCPLDMHTEDKIIPIMRIIEKLDEYLYKKDLSGAIRHAEYWIREAEMLKDLQGMLSLVNEQIGMYRKVHMEDECLAAIAAALKLTETPGACTDISLATTLINAATGYKEFDMAKEALPLYRQAEKLYETGLEPDDERFGGLYNNTALTLAALEMYDEAMLYYEKALRIMKKKDQGELECAITYLNMADLLDAGSGHDGSDEEISALIEKALSCINTEGLLRDGYYAFVCEKCAPVFGYYGYFMAEKELAERSADIYESIRQQ